MPENQTAFTEEEKEKVIIEFMPFVKHTAHRLEWRLSPSQTTDDLISAGLMGLLDALEKFDGRVKLTTYAQFRIKGAMLDELRAMDLVPRSTRMKISEIRKAQGKLEKDLGRKVEDEEIAEMLRIGLDEYYRILQDANGVVPHPSDESDEDCSILERIPDNRAKSPLDVITSNEMREHLYECLKKFPEIIRRALRIHYEEEYSLDETAKILGKSVNTVKTWIITRKSLQWDKFMRCLREKGFKSRETL